MGRLSATAWASSEEVLEGVAAQPDNVSAPTSSPVFKAAMPKGARGAGITLFSKATLAVIVVVTPLPRELLRSIALPRAGSNYLLGSHVREQQHIANGGGVGEQHNQSIDTNALARCWRQAVF